MSLFKRIMLQLSYATKQIRLFIIIFQLMSKKEMTLVYYYVPEDKDDPECPNVFGVPYAKQQLRLQHIHQSFPLKGSYLFRFKYNNEGCPVWLDLPDLDSKLPLYKDRIIVKATRVSWNQSKLHSQYRQKKGQIPQAEEKIDFFDEAPKNAKKQPVHIDIINEKPQPKVSGISGFDLLQGTHFEAVGSKKQSDLMGGHHGDLI